ncbi:MAG: outer membrane beta-barrel protein [Candidatus Acidiferrum sp.]
MKICTMWFAAAAVFLAAAIPSHAQAKFELDPFVGYETSGSYPISLTNGPSGSPVGGAPIDSLRVNGSLAFGTFIDYSLTENFQPEFMWNRNNTSYSAQDTLTGTYINAYHSVIDQYQFGGLYMFRNSEVKLRPYVAASLGFTHDENGSNTPNRTEFSFSLGGGVKYYLNRHVGLRGDLRYLPTYGSSSNELYCYYGCYYATVRNFLNRGSFTGGLVFAF